MAPKYDLWNMSDEEIEAAIDSTDFILYGNFRKEEKKKILPILEGNDTEISVYTNEWGNRALKIRIWNPQLKDPKNDILFREYEYSY